MIKKYSSLPQLLTEIRRLSDQRATGTLFITTEENRSAQICLEDGDIVLVYFNNKWGEAALKLLSEIPACKYRFQEGAVSRKPPLPTTDQILRLLGAELTNPPAATNSPVSATAISKEQKSILKNTLAAFIGPMAEFIGEDSLVGVQDLQTAIKVLAEEIPSSSQADKFREKIQQDLGLI